MLSFAVDSALWVETEGVLDWVTSFVVSHNLVPPPPPLLLIEKGPTTRAATELPGHASSIQEGEHVAMFRGMYFTAIEMAEVS